MVRLSVPLHPGIQSGTQAGHGSELSSFSTSLMVGALNSDGTFDTDGSDNDDREFKGIATGTVVGLSFSPQPKTQRGNQPGQTST